MAIKKTIFRYPLSIWVQSFVFLFLMIATLNNIVGSPAYLGDPLWGLPEFYFSEIALRKAYLLFVPIILSSLLGDFLGFLELEWSLIKNQINNDKTIAIAIHAHIKNRELPHSINHLRILAVNMIMRLLIIYYIAYYGFDLMQMRHYSQGNILQFPPMAGWYVVSIASLLLAYSILNKYVWSAVLPIYLKHGLKLTFFNNPNNNKWFFIVLASILRLGFVYIGIFIYMNLIPWNCGFWCIQIIPSTFLGILVFSFWSHVNKAEKTLSNINISIG